jgi:hypothetical protein
MLQKPMKNWFIIHYQNLWHAQNLIWLRQNNEALAANQ